MRFSFTVLSLIPAVLGGVINAGEDCHADNCYRAVAGSDPRYDITSRRELCASWMGATVTDSAASPTIQAKRAASTGDGTDPSLSGEASITLPMHATVCGVAAAYSSACSCWGVTALVAVDPTATGKPSASASNIDGPPVVDPTLSALASNSSSGASTRPTSSFVLDPTPSGKTTATGSIVDGSPTLGPGLSSTSPFNSSSGISTRPTTSSLINSTRSALPTSPSSIRPTSSSITSSTRPSTSSGSTTKPTTSPSTLNTRSTTSSPSTTRSSTSSTRTFTNTTITPTFTITTSPTPTPTGCLGATCETYRAWPCSGPLGDCLCGIDPSGASFCFEDNECALESNCNTNTDCPSGQRCVVKSCCLVGKCVIERKVGVCGNANGARLIFGLDRRDGGVEGGMGRIGERCVEGRNSGEC